MQDLVKALVKARKEFTPIIKDRSNPFHKTNYATLDSVLDAVTESLCDNGLAIVQTIQHREDGRQVLVTTLYHESGQSLSSQYLLPDINDAQKLGAAITYGRRYCVCAMLSVTADEDDDGNSVSVEPQKTKQQSIKTQQPKTVAVENPLASRVKTLIRMSGLSIDLVKYACQKAEVPVSSNEYTNVEQVNKFRSAIFCQWGLEQGAFNVLKHAHNSFAKMLDENTSLQSDEQIWQAWQAKVNQKLDEISSKAAEDIQPSLVEVA